MRVVVTGAGGGLGRAFVEGRPSGHDVLAFPHAELDVGDHRAVTDTIVPIAPEAIVNCAAMTNVDACEGDPDGAYRANAVGPHNLALAAKRCGAALLHVSTDYVFDGEKGAPYDELDATHPLSVYARSKLGGEERVRDVLPEHFVVRTGYVFGSGRDYLSRALERMERGETVGGIADRWGSPTYVAHLGERLWPLLATGRFGTYHLAGPEPTTWFDVLTRVRFLAGLPVSVDRQTADDLGLPAPRPRFSALTSLFLHEIGIDPLPGLDVALKEFLDGRRG